MMPRAYPFSILKALYSAFQMSYHLFLNFIAQCTPAVFNLDKKSKAQTFFPTFYNAKQVRISQENHLLEGFP